MAIRTDFTAGEVLAAADLNDTFAAKANLSGASFTGGLEATLGMVNVRLTNDQFDAALAFRKRRVSAIVQNGDGLGGIYFDGWNGSSYNSAAKILVNVDGVPGASADMPGRIGFYTTPNGSANAVERMRIDNAGAITGTGDSLGAWTAYSPTVTSAAGSITSYSTSCRYVQIGKIVIASGNINITNNGTGSGFIKATFPVSPQNTATTGSGRENAISSKQLQVFANGGQMAFQNYDSTYPAATGASLQFQITYEAA